MNLNLGVCIVSILYNSDWEEETNAVGQSEDGALCPVCRYHWPGIESGPMAFGERDTNLPLSSSSVPVIQHCALRQGEEVMGWHQER